MPPTVCDKCGARAPKTDARFCADCGAEFPAREPEAPPRQAPSPAEQFELLRAHADFAALQSHVPKAAPEFVSALRGVAGGIVFVAAGMVVMIPLFVFPPLAIALGLVLAVGFVFLVSSAIKAAAISRAALARVPARIVDERTEIDGISRGGKTQHYVSLESERGSRIEYAVNEEVAGRMAPGDVGIAFFKGATLVEFAQVPIDDRG